MKSDQLRFYIVRPALALLGPSLSTRFAEDLLIATCAQESRLGEYVHQVNGPALGIYQIEPVSLGDLWLWVQHHRPRWDLAIAAAGVDPAAVSLASVEDAVIYNLRFATLIARLFYYRVPMALPIYTTIPNLWEYYKTFYNTSLGAATLAEFETSLRLTDISGLGATRSSSVGGISTISTTTVETSIPSQSQNP